MNARVSKEEMALLMPASLSHYAPIAPEGYAGAQPRPSGFVRWFTNGFRWLAELPRRRAVLSELSRLSDHELSDIGLNRAELGLVFDPKFAANRSADRAEFRGIA